MFSQSHKSNARQVTLRTEAYNQLMYMLYLYMHIHMQAAVTMPYSTNLKVTHSLLGETFVFVWKETHICIHQVLGKEEKF